MPSTNADFYLYYTVGCHLCDDAERIIEPVFQHLGVSYKKVDIADSEALVEQYGIRIPVLLTVLSANELSWPFTTGAVEQFVRKQGLTRNLKD